MDGGEDAEMEDGRIQSEGFFEWGVLDIDERSKRKWSWGNGMEMGHGWSMTGSLGFFVLFLHHHFRPVPTLRHPRFFFP